MVLVVNYVSGMFRLSVLGNGFDAVVCGHMPICGVQGKRNRTLWTYGNLFVFRCRTYYAQLL